MLGGRLNEGEGVWGAVKKVDGQRKQTLPKTLHGGKYNKIVKNFVVLRHLKTETGLILVFNISVNPFAKKIIIAL